MSAKTHSRSRVPRKRSFPFAPLGVVCLASIFTLLAVGAFGAGTRRATARLTDAEAAEWVGTQSYVPSLRPVSDTLLTGLTAAFGIPHGRPIGAPPAVDIGHLTVRVSRTSAPGPAPSPIPAAPTTMPPAQPRPIALGWIPAGVSSANAIQLMRDTPGITVVSPGWLQLRANDGTIQSAVQPEVVRFAHQHHIRVWAMVDNQYSSSLAHAVLSNPVARQRFVQQLVSLATTQHLDGINVDFENMDTADQASFTTMIGQLHRLMRPRHLQVSVDITPDIVFLHDSDVYFHAGLAANADNLIVMAYDEHWGGDSSPGPVADVPWIDTALTDLLDTGVPADKLILGVPFYTRFWHVHADGSVTSDAYPTADVTGILASHHATGHWDAKLQLNYARYPKPDGYEEVWYATAATLRDERLLVQQLGLSGTAVWSLTLSDRRSWTTLVPAGWQPAS